MSRCNDLVEDMRSMFPCEDIVHEAADCIVALLAEREALLADKQRMDWLEAGLCDVNYPRHRSPWQLFPIRNHEEPPYSGDTLRATVDAAIRDSAAKGSK